MIEGWSSILFVINVFVMRLSFMSMTENGFGHGGGGYIDIAAILVLFPIHLRCLSCFRSTTADPYPMLLGREKIWKNGMENPTLLNKLTFYNQASAITHFQS